MLSCVVRVCAQVGGSSDASEPSAGCRMEGNAASHPRSLARSPSDCVHVCVQGSPPIRKRRSRRTRREEAREAERERDVALLRLRLRRRAERRAGGDRARQSHTNVAAAASVSHTNVAAAASVSHADRAPSCALCIRRDCLCFSPTNAWKRTPTHSHRQTRGRLRTSRTQTPQPHRY